MRIYIRKGMDVSAVFKAVRKVEDYTNIYFENNVKLEVDVRGKFINLRAKVKNSSGEGARRGVTGRRLVNGCFHLHGFVLDALFDELPTLKIISRGKTLTKGFFWNDQDVNIGSQFQPLMLSETCDC